MEKGIKVFKLLKNIFLAVSLFGVLILFLLEDIIYIKNIELEDSIRYISLGFMVWGYIIHIIFKSIYNILNYRILEDKDKYITKNLVGDLIFTGSIFLAFFVRLLLYRYEMFLDLNYHFEKIIDFIIIIIPTIFLYYYYLSFVPSKLVNYTKYFSKNNKFKVLLCVVIGFIMILMLVYFNRSTNIIRKVPDYVI